MTREEENALWDMALLATGAVLVGSWLWQWYYTQYLAPVQGGQILGQYISPALGGDNPVQTSQPYYQTPYVPDPNYVPPGIDTGPTAVDPTSNGPIS